MSVLIVGAGFTGSVLCKVLRATAPELTLTVWEKSRGAGGRQATKRDGEHSCDIGTQYCTHWKNDEFFKPYIKELKSTNVIHELKVGCTSISKFFNLRIICIFWKSHFLNAIEKTNYSCHLVELSEIKNVKLPNSIKYPQGNIVNAPNKYNGDCVHYVAKKGMNSTSKYFLSGTNVFYGTRVTALKMLDNKVLFLKFLNMVD